MLKILDHSWHQAHSYRLHALPAEFWYLRAYYHSNKKVLWDESQRPRPANFRGEVPVRYSEVPGSNGQLPAQAGLTDLDAIAAIGFDLAIAHLDQWVDRVSIRALPFRRIRSIASKLNIPMVCIMHGTPDGEGNRRRVWRLMGDLPVVCNSHQAAIEWAGGPIGRHEQYAGGQDAERQPVEIKPDNPVAPAFIVMRSAAGVVEGVGRMVPVDRYSLPQYRPIIHGYDVDEFWTEPLERRAVEVMTICSGMDLSRHYHGLPLLERLMRDVPIAWLGPAGNRPWSNNYAEYRAMLARTLVYFSPTRRAPMPGSRTEAMLSGACIVTVPGNDVETFIEHGRTGFIVDSYVEARDVLGMLLRRPDLAYHVGQAGREMARMAFSRDRYVSDWMSFLAEIGVTQAQETVPYPLERQGHSGA